MQNKYGPSEKSFQALLFSALHGLLLSPMSCLFEPPKAKDREQLDLIAVNRVNMLAGYQFKVNNNTRPDVRQYVDQAKGHADYFKIPVYLINFCLKGHIAPMCLRRSPEVWLW